MPQLLRADALSGFDHLVASFAGDADALLKQAGLDPQAARTSGRYISHRGFTRVLDLAASDLNCTDFGMRLGRQQSISVLGPIALAMEAAETLADVMHLVEHYIHVHDQSVIAVLHPLKQTDRYLFSVDVRVRGAPSVVQNRELAIAVAYETFTRLAGTAWRPLEVWFSHAPVSELAVYADYFACPIRFNQPASGLVMAAEALQLEISGHDAGRAAVVGEYLHAQFGAGVSSLTSKVEALIRPLLGVDRCSHVHVANVLAMHPRTLHRRLRLEGTSFVEIKETQRQRWASELLAQGLAAGRIAGLLGYGHDSAFTRACRRWFGVGPRNFRLAAAASAPVKPGVRAAT